MVAVISQSVWNIFREAGYFEFTVRISERPFTISQTASLINLIFPKGGVSVITGLCLGRSHVDELAALFALGEHHYAVDQSVEGMVFADTDVFTGMVNRSALTLDDIARFAVLTTENLHAESFAL